MSEKVVVQNEDNWYVAKCLENSVASQGKTIEEALDNLREATDLYYEDEKSQIPDRMDEIVKWQDVKNSMTSLSDEEKEEVDLMADIISEIIEIHQKRH